MNFKEFWSRYKGEIAKLYTTRLALVVFSIVCISPLLVFDVSGSESTVNSIVLLASVAVFAFHFYLIHSQLWTVGAKNKISADGGRLKLCPLAGVYMGLLASVPSFLFNIVNIITFYYKDYAGFRDVHQVTAIVELFWDAPAIGLFYVFQTPFAYLAASVLPVIFAGVAYFLGTKEFRLFGSGKKEQ